MPNAALEPVRYQLGDAGEIFHEHLIEGVPLRIEARDTRQERTGVHARVTLTLGPKLLAWTAFNVERDEDRVRLANSAYGRMDDIPALLWEKGDLKHALDMFCAGLWDAAIGRFESEELEGEGGMEPQEFAITPYIICGGGTMLFAPPGRGKSYTGMIMAVSVDAGHDSLLAVDHARPSLYINIERSRESMARRLWQVNEALGLDPARRLRFINARGRSLQDILEAARKTVREHHIEVVFLDSISRAGFGDLNENNPANKIIDALNGLCETWLALAHTPRADEGHIFGSVHFDAGVDIGVQMLSETKDDGMTLGIGLKIAKANDIRKPARPFMFALEFGELGLREIRPAKAGEFGEIGAANMTKVDEIHEFLLHYGEAQAGEIASNCNISRSRAASLMNADVRFHKRQAGRDVFYAARAIHVVS